MLVDSMVGLVVLAYLVGSIPCGYLIGRLHGIDDIRRYGSGVIGATNVGRILGLKYFFLVLLLDACKAYAFISLCTVYDIPRHIILVCAFAMLLGNSYSIFLGGSGGKGVATTVGIMLALNPLLCCTALMTWILVFLIMRTVGISSVITALVLPFYAMILTDLYGFLFIVIMAMWVIWRHRSNIYLFYVVR